ncbi:MAG TPA: hypothetical protein VF707_11375, partial [Ardenticatenaceae bacterium]
HEEELGTLLARLRERVAALLGPSGTAPSLDDLRALLIFAGQIQQAAEDALPDLLPPSEAQRQLAPLQELTAHAATAFYAAWAGGKGANREVLPALERFAALLRRLGVPEAARVTVKTPEGFAFYALYPEQYCAAALRWLQDHASTSSRRAVVVGIRSIGTTLGAVVAATVAAHGWEVRRVSARPTGHPFSREAHISQDDVAGAAWGLVVDEGPGQSGSSIAAVGAALARAGLPREGISFFPGHAGGPGAVASPEVRSWWETTPCYPASHHEPRFDGRPLPDALAVLSSALLQKNDAPVQVEDLRGGLWRSVVYPNADDWPAAFALFERPKYRCTFSDGTRLLWKFAGLAMAPNGASSSTEATVATLSARALAGWGAAPLGSAHGFVAVPWIEGASLSREDATPELLSHIGRYIAGVAGPPLTEAEQQAATARLNEMLYWNVWEALGEEAAAKTRHLSEAAVRAMDDAPSPRYGDGSLAPHEWVRSHGGPLVKVDNAGHDADHTIVGAQPLAWDVAGALVEWGLDEARAAPLRDAFHAAGGAPIPPAALTFYRLAYAAFRVGQSSLCAHATSHDPAEQARLWHAYGCYREEIARLLSTELPVLL